MRPSNDKTRSRRQPAADLSHIDTRLLITMGLNPDDFLDAAEGRRTSLLFTPFRQPRR